MARKFLNGVSITGTEVLAPVAQASGVQTALLVTGAADTAQTASTEKPDVDFDLARTVQWATGALSIQRGIVIRAPTYAFVAASTITSAATLAITGAPAAGTNATLTTSYSLWIQSGLLGTAASTTTVAGLRLPHGVAPTSPVDGDLWSTTTGVFARINGATAGPFGTGTIGGSIATGQVAVGSGTNAIAGTAALVWAAATGLSANRGSGLRNEFFGSGAGNTTLGAASTDNVGIGFNALNAMTTGGAGQSSYNTAVGAYAGAALTTGNQNTLIGYQCGLLMTTARFNVGIGVNAMYYADGDSNVGIGHGALGSQTSATNNVGVGFQSGTNNINGYDNVFAGYQAGRDLEGSQNVLLGAYAGYDGATVDNTTAVGFRAASKATIDGTVALGYQAAKLLTTSSSVTAIGSDALSTGTTNISDSTAVGNFTLVVSVSNDNTAVGSHAASNATASTFITIMGSYAGAGLVTGDHTTAIGYHACYTSDAGGDTALGSRALELGSGGDNIAIGNQAGLALDTGFANILIGNQATVTSGALFGSIIIGTASSSSYNGVLAIGVGATSATAANQAIFGSITSAYNDFYLGTGYSQVANASINISLNASKGNGTDSAGGDLNFKAGTSTGNAVGGALRLFTSKAGPATGAAQNTLINYWSLLQDGATDWTGIATANVPAVSAANHGTIFYDSSLQKFQYSQNTGAYADLISSATIGGSIAVNQIAFGSGSNTIQGSAALTYQASSSQTTGNWNVSPAAVSSGSSCAFRVVAAADTAQTTTIEASSVIFDLTATKQFATGSFATQRAFVIRAPTYSFVGASTITTAATLAITGAPITGANASLVNSRALWIQSGMTRFDGQVQILVGTPTIVNTTPALVLSRDTDGYTFIVECPNMTGTPAFGVQNVPVSTDLNSGKCFELKVTGEGFGRAMFYSDGKYAVGPGTGTRDTVLSRSNTSTYRVSSDGAAAAGGGGLEVMGRFAVGGGLVVGVQEAIIQSVTTSGSPSALVVTGGAHTTLTLSAEAIDVNLNLARTVQWSTGALTTQRSVVIAAPTYAFVGASTITTAATLAITDAPVAGTNATLTDRHALWIQAGSLAFPLGTAALPSHTFGGDANTGIYSAGADQLNLSTGGVLRWSLSTTDVTSTLVSRGPAGTAGAPTYSFSTDPNSGIYSAGADVIGFSVNGSTSFTIRATSSQTNGALNSNPPLMASGSSCQLRIFPDLDTNQTASTEASSIIFDLSPVKQFATGALVTQRAFRIAAPTYSFVGASTITNAATVAISGAPVAGTNATLTNSYAFWVQAGIARFDGSVGIGVKPTLYALEVIGKLSSSTGYILGADISLLPVAAGQSVITAWHGLQLVGNKQSTVDYTPTNIGGINDFSVIIPNQTAGAIGLIVKGQTAQTGNLIEVRDVANVAMLTISASGKLNTPATAASSAGLNVPHGTAPSSPVDGDLWTTAVGLFARINGATVQFGAGGTISGGIAANQIAYGSGVNAITGSTNLQSDGTSVSFAGAVSTSTNLLLVAGTTGMSSLRITPGVAPTSPVSGDLWATTEGPSYRAGTLTQSLANGRLTSSYQTGDFTITADLNYVEYTGAGGHTFTLPAANVTTTYSTAILVKNRGSGSITLSRAGADTIDDAETTSIEIKRGQSRYLVANKASLWSVN